MAETSSLLPVDEVIETLLAAQEGNVKQQWNNKIKSSPPQYNF